MAVAILDAVEALPVSKPITVGRWGSLWGGCSSAVMNSPKVTAASRNGSSRSTQWDASKPGAYKFCVNYRTCETVKTEVIKREVVNNMCLIFSFITASITVSSHIQQQCFLSQQHLSLSARDDLITDADANSSVFASLSHTHPRAHTQASTQNKDIDD